MRKLTALAIALAGTASVPAFAQDTGPYVGIDAGVTFPHSQSYEGLNSTALGLPLAAPGTTPTTYSDPYRVRLKTGFDGDINIGYDFGMFRLEAEGGYKRASVNVARTTSDNGAQPYGTNITSGHNSVYSLMANALVDFGPSDGVNFFVGAGAGVAWNKTNYTLASTPVIIPATTTTPAVTYTGPSGDFSDNRSAFAWQLLAGVRVPLSPSVDVGLKYRYFDAGRFNYRNDLDGMNTRFQSHSILAGIPFKFGRSMHEAAVQYHPPHPLLLEAATEQTTQPPPPPPP